MSPDWLDAKGLIALGLFTSIHAVHRAVKRGEIPPGTPYGRRFLWNRQRLEAFALARENPPRRKVVRHAP